MKYGPIICDPTSDEAMALVGKTVAFSSYYTELKDNCNTALQGMLAAVGDDGFFDVKGHFHSFIREVIEEKPTYRPYESCDEMVEDFKKRIMHKEVNPAFMPLIWVTTKTVLKPKMLITSYADEFVTLEGVYSKSFEELFDHYTYLDGSHIGKEVTDDR